MSIETKDGKIQCPLCKDYVRLMSIKDAANLVSVSEKTIRRHIDEGLVYSPKIAGKIRRVCVDCLFKGDA